MDVIRFPNRGLDTPLQKVEKAYWKTSGALRRKNGPSEAQAFFGAAIEWAREAINVYGAAVVPAVQDRLDQVREAIAVADFFRISDMTLRTVRSSRYLGHDGAMQLYREMRCGPWTCEELL